MSKASDTRASSSSPARPAASAAPPPSCSPSAGRPWPCWPAASVASTVPAADVEALGGTARCLPGRHRGRAGRRQGRRPGRGGSRRDRRLGQRRVHLGVRAVRRHRARGVRAGHRGDLPRLRERHPGRAAPDAAARPRHDRAGRLHPGLPRHPAAERLLRRQARHPGLPRVAAHRAAARRQQRPRDDGADARGEHPAVLLGPLPAAAPGAAGAADLPARGRRPGRRVRRRPPAPAGVLGRRDHRRDPPRQRRRAGPARPLPRPHRLRRPADRPAQAAGPAGEPLGAGRRRRTGATSAPTGSSTSRPTRRSPQVWASQHHGTVYAAGLALLAGATAAMVRAARR